MTEYKVVIPEEVHTILEFKVGELPGVAVVNQALFSFEPKEVFGWHLQINIECNQLVEQRMPSKSEQEILYEMEDFIYNGLKSTNPVNAIFLARVTLDGWRELVFRVFDPEIANSFLQKIISEKNHKRPFEFKIEQDVQWANADWFFEPFRE